MLYQILNHNTKINFKKIIYNNNLKLIIMIMDKKHLSHRKIRVFKKLKVKLLKEMSKKIYKFKIQKIQLIKKRKLFQIQKNNYKKNNKK